MLERLFALRFARISRDTSGYLQVTDRPPACSLHLHFDPSFSVKQPQPAL